jgi:hypothetical protein
MPDPRVVTAATNQLNPISSTRCWGAPGDFGPVIMPLDEALAFVASEGFFWIQA